MTILLYDYYDLEERASKSLRIWKGWHLVLFTLAAIFGVANYVVLQNTMQLVDNNCVLFPRKLEFRIVELPLETYIDGTGNNNEQSPNHTENNNVQGQVNSNETAMEGNVTEIGNSTHRLMLDTPRSLFGYSSTGDCAFAEYMPVLSTVVALVWVTMFTMCPGGGKVRSGLQQPWRILAPALIFSLIMVCLTGYSFAATDRGLHDFCAAFFDVSNSTTCSSANAYIEAGYNVSWGLAGRVAITRAASAGVWSAWACAAALLLARCLVAPDFHVRHTAVHLTKDPMQKVTPYLKKSRKHKGASFANSPVRDVSEKSDPTATTELVTVSVEPASDSEPTSLTVTPLRTLRNHDSIEMTNVPAL